MFMGICLLAFCVTGAPSFHAFMCVKRDIQEFTVAIYGAGAAIAYFYVMIWATLGIPRGQMPEGGVNGLIFTGIVGSLLTLMALRANKVWKGMDKVTRNTPASS